MEESERQRINELIKRIASGDEDALSLLYRQIGGRLFSVALGIVGDKASAEDVLQDSFLAIVNNADKFRFYQNGYGWACTIVKNTALNYLKARKRRQCDNIDDMCFLSSDEDTEQTAVDGITVREAIAKLESRQRAAIYYKYYLDMSVRQIASELKISKSQADRNIREAEAALMKIIDST